MESEQLKKCSECGNSFAVLESDLSFYQKMKVNVPDLCPQCGVQRMAALRNERILYRRKCDKCGREVISLYHSDAPYKVYCHDCWWSDKWEGLEFGVRYDSSKPLIEQFNRLQELVPREALIILNSTNSDYGNNIRESKDCYFSFLIATSEKVLYSMWMVGDKECMDDHKVVDSELVLHSVDIAKSYRSAYLQDSSDCSECYFSYDLKGCNHCLFSYNLRNKSYLVRNKQVTKEEYEEEIGKVLNGSFKSFLEAQNEYTRLKAQALRRFAFILKSSNVTGNYLQNCGKSIWCFDGVEDEEVRYVASILYSKNTLYSYSIGMQPTEFLFCTSVIKGGSNIKNSFNLFNCSDCAWCDSSLSSSNCIACVGLKSKEYCILNKQYTKEEYGRIAGEIEAKGGLAMFLPISFGTFAYNETAAQDYYPLTKEEALAKGYFWQDDSLFTSGKETVAPEKLPDNVKDVKDDIVKEILKCVECGRNYRVVQDELGYLRRFSLPVPRKCPQCRFKDRREARLPFKLWKRQCMCDLVHSHHVKGKCPNEFETSYSPERKEIVYCESCYNAEVV
jgi:hypothetical protein